MIQSLRSESNSLTSSLEVGGMKDLGQRKDKQNSRERRERLGWNGGGGGDGRTQSNWENYQTIILRVGWERCMILAWVFMGRLEGWKEVWEKGGDSEVGLNP